MYVSFNLLAMNYQRVHADARSICVETRPYADFIHYSKLLGWRRWRSRATVGGECNALGQTVSHEPWTTAPRTDPRRSTRAASLTLRSGDHRSDAEVTGATSAGNCAHFRSARNAKAASS